MDVKQIYSLVNDTTKEVLGVEDIMTEDLSNVVDVGETILSSGLKDNWVKSITNRIGKTVFVNRPYAGGVPSVYKDSWEYGSIMQKIRGEMPDAQENDSWDLQDNTDYPTTIFKKFKASEKFWNKSTTFEVQMSITDKQIRESFTSAGQLNAFLSMIQNEITKSMTVKTDSLIMRTINNMTAETIHDDFGASSLSSKSGIKAVNLLYLYNENINSGADITADECLTNPAFLKYAGYMMGTYADRLKKISTLFNIGGQPRFTPTENLHWVMLSDFARATATYLESDTFHNEFVKLPNAETVPYWQGSGDDYAFDSISAIDVTTASNDSVQADGILAVMFDTDTLGVCNEDRRVTSTYNPRAEFYNQWHKADARYFNDLDENFVVFFVA